MRDTVETGKKTGRRKISRQKNFTGQDYTNTTGWNFMEKLNFETDLDIKK